MRRRESSVESKRKAKEVHWFMRGIGRDSSMQRAIEQKGECCRYDREAAMLRRSVYLSPRDPPVQLLRSVPKQLDLDEQAHEGLHSVPATEPERRPQSALLCRRSKSRVNHGRMSKIPPVSCAFRRRAGMLDEADQGPLLLQWPHEKHDVGFLTH